MPILFRLGLVINPIAGVGGSVALKGSDGENTVSQALALGGKCLANEKTARALEVLLPYRQDIEVITASGLMGEKCALNLNFSTQVVYHSQSEITTALDTENSVEALKNENIDLLLFAGGDGTARDVCRHVDGAFPVLGVPAGCKIHSGVYAVTAIAAGRVVEKMLSNQLVTLTDADVMDIDESLFREGVVKAKRYGEMTIPSELQYVQAVKSGGKESDELVLQDIADYIIDNMDDELFIIGSGSTTGFVMEQLGLDNTLLGVDIIQNQSLIKNDITEPELWQLLNEHMAIEDAVPIKLLITLIGGQGHILGRGNQQLSPRIIRLIGTENILLVATKSKLQALEQRPLIVDSGDPELDQSLTGFLPVITGYNDQVLYAVQSPS